MNKIKVCPKCGNPIFRQPKIGLVCGTCGKIIEKVAKVAKMPSHHEG
jgi:uncharacterized Zn finger protein (UPF0148 family)